MVRSPKLRSSILLVAILGFAVPVLAILPASRDGVASKGYRAPGLEPPVNLVPADDASFADLGVQPGQAFIDTRTGRWGSLVLTQALIPGSGNSLSWGSTAAGTQPEDTNGIAAAARDEVYRFLSDHASVLGVDVAELDPQPKVTVHDGGHLVQIRAQRVIDGMPVRDAELTAVLNGGNLVLLGLHEWADPPASTLPSVSDLVARATLQAHLAPYTIDTEPRAPRLELVPFDDDGALEYRLAWVLAPRFFDSLGSWEAMVDAGDGEMIAFRDTNHYAAAQRGVVGGVLPVANDNLEPDGVEHPDYPMPFADVTELDTLREFVTDSGGNAPVCLDGPIAMSFDSEYVTMLDFCGPSPLVTSEEDTLDLGIAGYPQADPHPGTNCALVTSPTSSAVPGNTRASRSGFYEVNRLKEQARGQLPDNLWLRDNLTARMNVPGACNAFWDGATINFYPDTGACRNTGEIAAVFDHEWGHGMDANDARPGISSPGESIADTYTNLRLAQSCTGRGFVRVHDGPVTLGCGHGYGDPCTDCDGGIRDSDYLKHVSQTPHDVEWALAACVSTDPTDQLGPCNGETHCEGTFVAEATWDLLARDLRCQGSGWTEGGAGDVGGGQCAGGAAPARDFPTSLELATKLVYHGGGFVGDWFQCRLDGTAGCNADSGYLNYLAADDDNGDLNDGTPHMSAIHAAFTRHGMACDAIPVQDSGCTDRPTEAPVVSVTPLDKAVQLTWQPIAGASRYEIFRTEGVFGCDFGKIKVGETTDTEFLVTGLRNGFETYFMVAAAGTGDTCLGPMSACTVGAAAEGGPGLAVDEGSLAVEITSGDGDLFLDNCETADLTFTIRNTGTAPLTDLRIVSVTSPSHPSTFTSATLPATVSSSVPVCGEAQATLEIVPGGMSNNDALEIEVALTSDELEAAGLAPRTTFVLETTEGDFRSFALREFDFESGLGMWRRLYGQYTLASDGGAEGTSSYLASSSFADSSCDGSATPLVRLTPESTLELSTNFEIELATAPPGVGGWDRANVRLRDFATGEQSVVEPSGGRVYNLLPGSAGEFSLACRDMPLQPAWGEEMPTWAPTTFTAEDLGAAEAAGEPVQLVVQYGTDAAVASRGFWFDQVRLTNAEIEVPDTQSDVCRAPCSELDDSDPAIEYFGGWQHKSDPDATHGAYHRRVGNNPRLSTARVVFEGDEITYLYGTAQAGGTADIFVDGQLVDTLSYKGSGDVDFGRAVTYGGFGSGSHEFLIVHRSKKVFVDGFRIGCDGDGGADASAPEYRAETESSEASADEGPILSRSFDLGPETVELSVLVEGAPAPVVVQLLDPLGLVVAQGEALIEGSSLSGLDVEISAPGTYTVQVVNTLPAGGGVTIHAIRTELIP